MKKIFFLVFCHITAAGLFAQKATRDFQIALPEQKISNSLYNKIDFLDSRLDTTNMGIVQVGAFNRKARVIAEIPLPAQVEKVFQAAIDSTAQSGTLLLQLKQLSFAEVTGALSEKGYCYVRAVLYAMDVDSYQKLHAIDTVILVKSMDVTKGLFRNGSKVIYNFISESLTQAPLDTTKYTYHDVLNIDSIDKRKLKVYNVSTYEDGLYETYQSFLKQQPDGQVTEVKFKQDTISSVKIVGDDGERRKIRSKKTFAVIHNGKIYIATDYGYYPAEKKGDDFFFTGRIKVPPETADVVAASFFFGVLGGLIVSNANATLEMKIDHLTGGFIRLGEKR